MLLSTVSVDNSVELWIKYRYLSTALGRCVDGLWINKGLYALELLQSCFPEGEGKKRLSFTFDVVGDLVDLVKGVSVAVYKIGYLGGSMHDG